MNIELKSMLLEMFGWFHGFCGEQGLRYYALGGTMLGAVRHQGFIPWDDDIDVGMPREDYTRLAELLRQHPNDRYCLETPDSTAADFFYPFAKLYDTRTTLVENTRYKIRRGIYLDIFPLDGAGETEEEARRYFAEVKWRRCMLLGMTAGIRDGRSGWKNLWVYTLRMVPDRVVEKKKQLRSIDAISAGRPFDGSLWVGNMMGAWMERELMPREVLGDPTPYCFEGMTVYGPEDGEEYLTRLYGDWRQLPPSEQRKSRHDYVFMDLKRSYLEI